MDFKTATWNARSIFRKKLEFINFLEEEKIDVIAVTETHLQPHMSFNLPNHSFIRLDRQTAQGGIGIAVHRNVKFRTLTLPNTWFIEAAGIEIFTTQGNFKFLAAYCPKQAKDSDGTSAVLRQELRSLRNTSGHFITAGDLNAKHQVWGNQRGNKNGQILWEAAQNGLFTIAHPFQPTFVNGRSMSIIDILMTNMPDRMNDQITISALSSDHLPVVLKVENNTPHPTPPS